MTAIDLRASTMQILERFDRRNGVRHLCALQFSAILQLRRSKNGILTELKTIKV